MLLMFKGTIIQDTIKALSYVHEAWNKFIGPDQNYK